MACAKRVPSSSVACPFCGASQTAAPGSSAVRPYAEWLLDVGSNLSSVRPWLKIEDLDESALKSAYSLATDPTIAARTVRQVGSGSTAPTYSTGFSINQPPRDANAIKIVLGGVLTVIAVVAAISLGSSVVKPVPACTDVDLGDSQSTVVSKCGSPDRTQQMRSVYGEVDMLYYGRTQIQIEQDRVTAVNKW